MADETEPDAPAPDSSPAEGDTSEARAGTGAQRDAVRVPSWLAAALVVVLGLAIGGAGFAIGRATASDDGNLLTPIVRRVPGPDGRYVPGFPGGPRFPGFPGGQRYPGGEGRRGECHEREHRDHEGSTTTTTVPHT